MWKVYTDLSQVNNDMKIDYKSNYNIEVVVPVFSPNVTTQKKSIPKSITTLS